MPDYRDDLDDLLRRAMKTLDDQVPSGYFEALPTQTLARLEDDSSMQPTGTSTSANESSATGVPPQDRDEDSGLHDIRSMASSTKMRLSSKRVATTPPIDDDILASSSAGWKAVALPEPARMVSLPELGTLPSAAEVNADKPARPARHERTSAKKLAKAAVAIESSPVAMAPAAAPAVTTPTATSVEPAAVTPIIGARLAHQKSQKSKTGLYAVVGLGLAAAAGAAFFVMTNKSQDKAAAPQQVAAVEPKPAPAPAAAPVTTVTTTPIEPEPTPVAPPPEAAIASDSAAAAPAEEAKAAAPAKAERKRGKDADKAETRSSKGDGKAAVIPPAEVKKPAGGASTTGGEDGEPSFDQLLKEAGVTDKKPAKPKLDKKALSGADIKAGMSSVAGKALACYAGTQGTAQVKLTVGPDGKVQKATVTGAFAGTPVGSCVEAAVKSATFPPWDGGPQSFGYSYLLAE